MCSQPIHKVIFLGRKFFLPNCQCDVANTDLEKKLTRTEGDKNIGRIRSGFMLTEKSLTLHSKPEIQYEQSSKPWYKNPEPNRTRVKTSPTTGGKQGGTRKSRANEENARGMLCKV